MPFDLDAGAFAFVMATGIVSIAASQQGAAGLSVALLLTACLAWLALLVRLAGRALAVPGRRPRLQSFALVAATAVIGARFALAGDAEVALALWSASCLFSLLLVVRRPRVDRICGGTLLIIVAAESLSALAALLAPRWVGTPLLGLAFVGWLLGLLLYPLVTGRIAGALKHSRRFEPDLWIVMGALAITTLAGSQLLLTLRTLHTLNWLNPWLRDTALATWTAAAALVIPLTLIDLHARSSWHYEPGRWSFVFPLGMFSAATTTLAHTGRLPFLHGIARAFFLIAFAAWTLVSLTAAHRTVRSAHGRSHDHAPPLDPH